MNNSLIFDSLLQQSDELVYPYPELEVLALKAYSDNVTIELQWDTFGDDLALNDFTIKINGTPATLDSWLDSGDSVIKIYINETIENGDIIILSYAPNPARWILGPWTQPEYVLFEMIDESVTNLVV